ncbi:peptidyl-prolyl cis-trans isomerase [Pseudonocardia halophobica]|uniref:peptidyl-prolyl cis-trans isomerase n=1 Tax=Pseudonocardia halophobica TaxID=29401 RepID=UPI003D8F037E
MNTSLSRNQTTTADMFDGVVDGPVDGMVDETTPTSSTPVAPVEPVEPVEPAEPAESAADTEAEAAVEAESTAETEPETDGEPAAESACAADAEPADAEPAATGKSDAGSEAAQATGLGGRAAALTARVRALRPPATRRGRIVLAAVLAVVLLAGAGGGVWWWTTRLPDGVAFRVAGQDVTVADLDQEVQTLSALYGMQVPDRTADPGGYDRFRRDMAKASAIGRVVDAAAAEQHVVVPDKQVQDFLARYISQYFGDGADSRSKFVAALGDAGTSEQAVDRELARQMAASRLFDQVTKDVPAVTDADVDAAFVERKDALATPERRTLSNIVVPDEATATRLKAQIDGGAPFADVARASSADQATKAQGGAIGTLAAAQLEQGFADAAFAAPQGGVFGPVQTTHGWNVGVVTAIQPGAPADPAAVREPLKAQLQAERRNDAWRSFLGARLADAAVRYADDYLPADPDGLPEAPTATPAG